MTTKAILLQIEPNQDQVLYRGAFNALATSLKGLGENAPRVYFVMPERKDLTSGAENPHPYDDSFVFHSPYLYYRSAGYREIGFNHTYLAEGFDGVTNLVEGEEFFEAAQTKLEVEGAECLFIATSEDVVAAAERTGMQAVTYEQAPNAIATLRADQ